MSLAQTLLPEFDHEMAGCRKALERVPDEHFDYQPHAKSSTMEQLCEYLRMLEVPVPALYGPSADETGM